MKDIYKTAEEMRGYVEIAKRKEFNEVMYDILKHAKDTETRCEIYTGTEDYILNQLKDLGYRIYKETHEEKRVINIFQKLHICKPYVVEHTKLYVDWSEEGDDNMFRLIDYKEHEFSDGFSGQIDYYYKVENVNTGECKWVNKYEYENMKRQGFIK